jgi:hypothetical protein
VCVSNGRDTAVCSKVDPTDCRVSVSVDVLLDDFAGGSFGFVDDTDGTGAIDSGEPIARDRLRTSHSREQPD